MHNINDKNFWIIIIGNKYDLKDQRKKSEKLGLKTAKK
mgnify:CR=1 FL=1